MEIIGLKAPGNYSATYNLSLCLWESPQLLISMISGFLDVSPSPKNQHDLSLETPGHPTKLKDICKYFINTIFVNFTILEIQIVVICGKTGTDKGRRQAQ